MIFFSILSYAVSILNQTNLETCKFIVGVKVSRQCWETTTQQAFWSNSTPFPRVLKQIAHQSVFAVNKNRCQ